MPMRRRGVLAGLAGGVVLTAGARAAATEPPPLAGRGLQLVKNWDFRDTVTDAAALRGEFFTRYIYEAGRLDHLNDEWQRYRDEGHHRFGPQGLSLVAAPEGDTLAPGRIGRQAQ